MKFARIMLPLVWTTPILLGCSTPAVAPVTATAQLKVEPLLRVRDAASTALDFYQLGRYYQGQNRFAQAADAYRKALDYHKDDIEARNALATTYSAQGKLEQAIAEFEAILKIKPELAHLHNNLGYTYYLQGSFGKAILAFETATMLEPQNSRAYNNLGLAYRKMGDHERSRLAFSRAAELTNPGSMAAAAIAESIASANSASVNIASATSSITLKNNTPSIALPPLSTSVGSDLVAEPYLLAHRGPESIGLNNKGEPAEINDPAMVAAVTQPQAGDKVVASSKSKPFRLEIANGNGVTGMARKVGAMLTQYGLPAPHLTNLEPYGQPASFIQYRNGFHDQALRLGQTLSQRPVLISNDRLRRGTDVQLVLGKDMTSPVALLDANAYAADVGKKIVEPKGAG